MKFAVFYRNVNLGRPKSPTRTQLEAALVNAGAASAVSFQTNGTVVFEADSEPPALEIMSRAGQELKTVCGLDEPAFTCTVAHLAELAAAEPFAKVALENVYLFCVTLAAPADLEKLETPLWSPRRDVLALRATRWVALGVSLSLDGRPGNVNAFLEKSLQAPATTRSWNTILRLVKKFGKL